MARGTITFRFDGKNGKPGTQFRAGVTRYAKRQIKAIQNTAYLIAEDAEEKGRADIRAAGNFGSERWQEGLQAKVSYQSQTQLRVRLTHDVKYWRVFEYAPTVIKGKPLLWIPLNFAADAQGIMARDFPDPLFRVDRQGKAPLLLSDSGPKYFGKEQVTIRTKWHLRRVFRNAVKRAGAHFRREMKRLAKGG